MVALPQHSVSPSGVCDLASSSMCTDALRVELAAHIELSTARQMMESYGDIISLEEVAGPPGLEAAAFVVCVVYYDVRSAAHVMSSLGLDRCVALPQHCNREVHVTGDFQIDAASVQGVSNVRPAMDGAFILEFFDSRNAAQMEESVRCWSVGEKAHSDASTCFQEACEQVAVHIDGLPTDICNKVMLEVMLEQAGLEESVVSIHPIHPQKGSRCGSAEVVLKSKDAAKIALRHFTGFSWDHRSGKKVSSTIVRTLAPAIASKTPVPKDSAKQYGSLSASDDGASTPCSSQSLASPPPGLSHVAKPSKQRRIGRESATMATASTCTSEPNSDCEIVEVLA